MRYILSGIFFLSFIALSYTQFFSPIVEGKKLYVKPKSSLISKGGFDQFVVDFDMENEQLVGSANYQRSFWQLNDTASLAMKYAVLRADSFPFFGSNQAYPISFITGIRLDSIDLLIAHKNLSGGENKVILEFAHTDASWHPTSNVFASDTFSFIGPLFPGNNLDTAHTIRLRPGIWYTGGVPVAIRIQFVGAVNDTFLLGAGFPVIGTCGIQPKIGETPFKPNSYAYYNLYNELLPTAIGGDVFQDCDGLPGKDSIADGASAIQNWCASMFLSVGTLSVEDNSNSIFKVYPNPTNQWIYIDSPFQTTYWEIIDISGRKLLEGQGTNVNMNDYPSGIYFLKIKNLPTFDIIKISKQ